MTEVKKGFINAILEVKKASMKKKMEKAHEKNHEKEEKMYEDVESPTVRAFLRFLDAKRVEEQSYSDNSRSQATGRDFITRKTADSKKANDQKTIDKAAKDSARDSVVKDEKAAGNTVRAAATSVGISVKGNAETEKRADAKQRNMDDIVAPKGPAANADDDEFNMASQGGPAKNDPKPASNRAAEMGNDDRTKPATSSVPLPPKRPAMADRPAPNASKTSAPMPPPKPDEFKKPAEDKESAAYRRSIQMTDKSGGN